MLRVYKEARMKIGMNVMKTKNAISLEHNVLREVDDFNISIKDPEQGKISIILTLGELPPVTSVLCADSNDLQKLKEWMESIARDESLTSASLGSGTKITCKQTDIPEKAVDETYRYLDELFPSPLAVISITTDDNKTYSAVLKIKHFINALYVTLMMHCVRTPEKLTKQWYPYTEEYKKQESFKQWIANSPYHHQSLVASSLIEWYLQSTQSYTSVNPKFKYEGSVAYIVTMWTDYGCIFWKNGISIGEITSLEINDLNFDFSDVEGLREWYDDFYCLADSYRVIAEDKENEESLMMKIKEWHIKGFRLAQEIRRRLPLNVILLYLQSWDVGHGQRYFAKDKGRIIFDSRKIGDA